jgi:glycosyltransferase involved in cell wall biosynthesis
MIGTQPMSTDAEAPATATGLDVAVDVVIDNYNYGRFIANAIESALGQTHPNVKVIVVDDGSTDESRDVIGLYENRVDVVLKENGGQASALNAGFSRCEGDAVIFLDSDDVLRPDAAALVARAFAAEPDAVKVQYRMEVIAEDGSPTGDVQPLEHLPLPTGDVRQAELTFPFDLVWMGMSGNAFRTSALRRLMPIPEREYGLGADWYLVHLAPLLGRVVSLGDVAGRYRIHGSNMYASPGTALDLAHVRDTILYAAATRDALDRLAGELLLERPPGPILSVADIAHRLVCAKLAPELHPLPDDRVVPLALDGMRAAWRRFDVSSAMKILLTGWFAVMAVAPRPLARRLAERFLLPQRRPGLNRLLRHLHRWKRTKATRW